MGWGYNDIHVLAPKRSAAAACRFLDEFVPDREPGAAEYEFPEFAEHPEVVFRDWVEAVNYAAKRPSERHLISFRNPAADQPALAMVYFTGDGGMILGISISAGQEDRVRGAVELAEWLARVQAATGAEIGYALHESPPSYETIAAFVGDLSVALAPKLVDSQLVFPSPGEEFGPVWLNSHN